MHILYLHQYFVPPDGSGGTRSYEMAKRFVQAGHKVTILTSSAFFPESYQFKDAVNKLSIDGINLRILHVPYSNNYSFAKRIQAFTSYVFKSSYDVVKIENVDLIFATSTPLTIALPGVFAKFWHRCKMVFEVRDLWPEIPIALGVLKNPLIVRVSRLLERFAYRNSDHIVALSHGMAKGIIASGYVERNVTVVPNSSDVELFRAESVSADRFRSEYPMIPDSAWVVYAGTLGQANGIDYMVKIASEMLPRNKHIQFVVVGDGKCLDEIKKVADKFNVLNTNFWMLPSIPKNMLPDLLSAATLTSSFVVDVPALWNNSANKFFDAFAAQRPIAINHEGWQADFLRESGAGLVLPPDDAAQAARLIDKFIKNTEGLDRSRSAAARAADEVFGRDLLANRLIQVLEDVGGT